MSTQTLNPVTTPLRFGEVLDQIPAYERNSPTFTRLIRALLLESQRVEAAAQSVADSAIAARATLANGGLPRFEAQVGAHPSPSDTEGLRRAAVAGRLAARNVSTSARWKAAITALGLGTPQITKLGDSVEIRIPGSAGSAGVAQVQSLVRAMVPAHLTLTVLFVSGFRVDYSKVDQDAV